MNTRQSRTSRRFAGRKQARSYIEALEARQLLSAFTPAQIRHAYGFDQITFSGASGQTIQGDGSGQTIAIVDAYNDPNIASDLQTFNAQYGLPNTDANGNPVLTIATPQGSPRNNGGWAQEISIDVEWAHAIAPKAHILLVEAKSNSLSNLFSAVDYARNQSGVVAVSMSWGGGEFSSESSYDYHFTTPAGHIGGSGLAGGITFVASSGDSGAPPEYPAISPNVLAVGGTSLTLNADNTWNNETGWSSSGGGISAYESKPTYQSSVTQSSTKRTGPDVAYDADPNTGIYVYDSYSYQGLSGWIVFGGTSIGAPQWASLVAIADQGRAISGVGSLNGFSQTLPAIYNAASTNFHDVTSGNNGYPAGTGYDLVTGRGTPLANTLVPVLVSATATGTVSGGTAAATTQTASSGPAFATSNHQVASAVWDAAGSDVLTLRSDLPDRVFAS